MGGRRGRDRATSRSAWSATVIPWNGPVATASLKISPALAAGCTVVLKPAPEGPVSTLLLAEALEAAELPEGVISVLPASREVGEHLVRHRGIDKVSFTGSTAAGRRVMSLCGERIARVTLELGGKSAGSSATTSRSRTCCGTLLPAGFGHSGQVCAAITRIFVSRSRHDELVEAAAEVLRSLPVGDPRDPGTVIGPLAAERQRDRVEGYIAKGKAEGATPGHRRRPPRAPRQGLVRRADPVRQRHQRHDDRPRGDLRPGAHGDPVRRRGRRRADGQRLRLRALGRGLHQRPRAR